LLAPLYVILDADTLARLELPLLRSVEDLLEAGVRCIQYRDKQASRDAYLRNARALAEAVRSTSCSLLLNDHADLVRSAGADGVHVGQGDLSPAAARELIGAEALVGVSAHGEQQIAAGDATSADYLAIGPVFATKSKKDPEPVVGLEGVRRARALTTKHLVAIGGLTPDSIPEVLAAGANSVAVIGSLFTPGRPVRQAAEDLLSLTGN
jgi:thiamine-phosphate pyrophosphorylase